MGEGRGFVWNVGLGQGVRRMLNKCNAQRREEEAKERKQSFHTHPFSSLFWNGNGNQRSFPSPLHEKGSRKLILKSQAKPDEWRGVEKFVDLNPQGETQWTRGGSGEWGGKGNKVKRG
jgi:hypothetical protein